jgi:hypothetical protein
MSEDTRTTTEKMLDGDFDKTFAEKRKLKEQQSLSDATSKGEDVSGQLEFPEIPEASNMGGDAPSLIEGLIPNLKVFFTRDDVGKTEILENAFKDDDRWGGAFQDKFGNPMIKWKDKVYYMNKPGMSGTDFGTFVGELIKFTPATKIVSGAKNIVGTIARGIPAYSTTELAGSVAEKTMTPKTTKAKKEGVADLASDVGISTAIGVGSDVLVPPALRTTAKVAGKVVPESVKNVFPLMTEKILSKSKYPLTAGQRTADPYDQTKSATIRSQTTDQLKDEDILRQTKVEGGGGDLIKQFDARQLDLIRADAKAFQDEMGSGLISPTTTSAEVPYESASAIKNIIEGETGRLKGVSEVGYEAVRKAADQPIVTAMGMNQATTRALQTIADLQLSARELADFPQLAREIRYLQKLQKMSANPRFKGSPFKLITGYQKTINRLMRDAATKTEKKAFGQIKSVIDDSVFNGIEQGFITGNKEVIDTLFEAKEAYRKYIGLTGEGKTVKSENAANAVLRKISDPDLDPKSFVNSLFGHAKFNPSNEMIKILKRFKQNLPEENFNEVVGLIKDGIIEKAFSGAGKSGVTRKNIVDNYSDVFVKNRKLINELFSPEELKRIKLFREDVIPTMWADPSLVLNASGTSYGVFSAANLFGILSLGKYIPVSSGILRNVAEEVEAGQSINKAREAIKQYALRSQEPLLRVKTKIPFTEKEVSVDAVFPSDVSRSVATGVRQDVLSDDSPSAQNILNNIDDATALKIMEQMR